MYTSISGKGGCSIRNISLTERNGKLNDPVPFGKGGCAIGNTGGGVQFGRDSAQLVPAGTKKAFAPGVQAQVQITSDLYLCLEAQVQVQI